MSNPTVTGILCGNCKHYHPTVAAVRVCHASGTQIIVNRPEQPLPTSGPLATAKQKAFIAKLCDERNTTPEFETNMATLTMGGASALITNLLARPKATKTVVGETTTAPKVPAGRYAIEVDGVVKFFKVDCPTEGPWAGRTFVKIQASDDFHRVNREVAQAVLVLIAKDPAAASKLYGKELGKCGVCGRTLTDEESRANGIGPICAGKAGW